MDITITLTDAENTALTAILNGQFTLEQYVKNLIASYLKQKREEDWNKLTDEEKEAILNPESGV